MVWQRYNIHHSLSVLLSVLFLCVNMFVCFRMFICVHAFENVLAHVIAIRKSVINNIFAFVIRSQYSKATLYSNRQTYTVKSFQMYGLNVFVLFDFKPIPICFSLSFSTAPFVFALFHFFVIIFFWVNQA